MSNDHENKTVEIRRDPQKHLQTVKPLDRRDPPKREETKQAEPVKQNQPRQMSENPNKGFTTKAVSFASLVVSVVVLCVAFGIYANTIPRPCPTLPELAKQTFRTYDSSYKEMIEAKKSIPQFIK